jgi:hypothetical protein
MVFSESTHRHFVRVADRYYQGWRSDTNAFDLETRRRRAPVLTAMTDFGTIAKEVRFLR